MPSVWLAANTSWYLFNFRTTLIARLVAGGYQVVTLAPVDQYSSKLEELGARHVRLEIDNAGMNPIKESVCVLRLASILGRQTPSLLLTYTPKPNIYGCLAAAIAGVPVVANVSGLGRAFIKGGWLGGVVQMLYRASLKHAARVFFQNADDLDFFIREALVAKEKARLLPGSGVDVNRFIPRTRPERNERFVFLLVARLLRDKGISEYIEAAREVARENHLTEFKLVGFSDNGNPTAFLSKDIARWRAEGIVDYLGPTDNVIEHYAVADCVVLPSYREGCPRTLLEAASMGIPLIATDVPGCRQVVEDEVNGLLCRPYDAADLARKMKKMINLPVDERMKMGVAGREKMLREFDEKLVLDEYMSVVREFGRK